LNFVWTGIRQRPPRPFKGFLPLAPLLLLSTTGCLRHTRVVQVVQAPPVVMRATAEELVSRLNGQFNTIQSLTTIVQVVASVGGGTTGKVTEYHPFHGAIIIEKPRNLRVILQVPLLGSAGMDMVSDGHDFKMVIPLENRALVGKDEVVKPSSKPLENLRPGIFFDSMLIQGLQPDEDVSLTESSRLIQPTKPKQPVIEEPDYDLRMFRPITGNLYETVRVVHFNRTTLLPYEQDIYDPAGHLQTTAMYEAWQRYPYRAADGSQRDIQFPSVISIARPMDGYSLKITISKLTANQKMEPDQFELCIPAGYKVRNMDDPSAPVTIAPSTPCGTQSQH
jgi:outer membrane lipoprotein-sorting protein